MVIQNGRYQGIVFKGTKFYYNPWSRVKDLYWDYVGLDGQNEQATEFLHTGAKYYPPTDR